MIVAASLFFYNSSLRTELLGGSNCSGSELQDISPIADRAIALIDQLGSTYPSPGFVQQVNFSANKAGYRFDYYPPNSAGLDFFIHLPRHDYAIIILRTHGMAVGTSAIATSERYGEYHRIVDQLQDNLGVANINGSLYFSLNAGFISKVMCGRFPGTVVMALGCGLMGHGPAIAGAFLERGAAAFVGWDNAVTLSRTDSAFASLTELLLEGYSLNSSIQQATGILPPDPFAPAHLSYLPISGASLKLPI